MNSFVVGQRAAIGSGPVFQLGRTDLNVSGPFNQFRFDGSPVDVRFAEANAQLWLVGPGHLVHCAADSPREIVC